MKHNRIVAVLFASLLWASVAHADVSIEATASQSRVEVGDQLTYDVIVTNAEGKIANPKIGSLDGFTAYSQGHSQEFSMVNGVTSSRSVFSYSLVANSVGKKIIGPVEVTIGGTRYKVAPVEVEVTSSMGSAASRPVSSRSAVVSSNRPLPSGDVSNEDIFVNVSLDKDDVFVNEPAMLTYTLYTRLPATYKGFEKEAVTTGFWVEDFPPEKTIKQSEKNINGSRYVVADVRKLALFPTESGEFTVDPGTISATVEILENDPFDRFMSSNIFGRRTFPPSMLGAQMVSKEIIIKPIKIHVKAMPEEGKPTGFEGAVGSYLMEGAIDKNQVQAGDPVTFRIRVWGRGNISTLALPKISALPDFKIYDASSSTNLSKDKLVVEGEKVSETVMVPTKAGTYTIPSVIFSYFDTQDKAYKVMKTDPQVLTVTGSAEPEDSDSEPASSAGVEPAQKESVVLEAKDIRYIKTTLTTQGLSGYHWHTKPLFWILNGLIFGGWFWVIGLGGRKEKSSDDLKGLRFRRSHALARKKLRAASKLLKEEKQDEFYAEVGRAVYAYFADKLNVPVQAVTIPLIEERGDIELSAELVNRIHRLFDELSSGRFSRSSKTKEQMQELYDKADEVITQFERVKIKP